MNAVILSSIDLPFGAFISIKKVNTATTTSSDVYEWCVHYSTYSRSSIKISRFFFITSRLFFLLEAYFINRLL